MLQADNGESQERLMSGRIVYLNGEFVPEAGARISIFDSALDHRGHGV